MHNLGMLQDSFELCNPQIHEKLLNVFLSDVLTLIIPQQYRHILYF